MCSGYHSMYPRTLSSLPFYFLTAELFSQVLVKKKFSLPAVRDAEGYHVDGSPNQSAVDQAGVAMMSGIATQ